MHSSSSDDHCFILPATKTRKMHTSRRDAFKPINCPPIAKISYQGNSLQYIDKPSNKEGKLIIRKSITEVRRILKNEYQVKIKNLAKNLTAKNHIYIIGRGVSYPIALETALKIKEASYIHAEGFAGGELKHGVIALVDKGTPCLAFLPEDETYPDTTSGVMEMKARGGYMIGIGSKNQKVFDEFLEVHDCGIATMIPNILVGQLLGYYLAVNKGLDPDKPRNLAKSVTVK